MQGRGRSTGVEKQYTCINNRHAKTKTPTPKIDRPHRPRDRLAHTGRARGVGGRGGLYRGGAAQGLFVCIAMFFMYGGGWLCVCYLCTRLGGCVYFFTIYFVFGVGGCAFKNTHTPPGSPPTNTRLPPQVFADKRNDPCAKAISHLSPYFNYGQLSVQAVMLKVLTKFILLCYMYACGRGGVSLNISNIRHPTIP